jgi:hypothetical protein
MRISEKVTPSRLAWLRQLEREGTAQCARGQVAFQCRKLGWTQWAQTDGKETISRAEFLERFPWGAHEDDATSRACIAARDAWEFCGEMLTDAGRAILAENKDRAE